MFGVALGIWVVPGALAAYTTGAGTRSEDYITARRTRADAEKAHGETTRSYAGWGRQGSRRPLPVSLLSRDKP
jgi:hypothetical protein